VELASGKVSQIYLYIGGCGLRIFFYVILFRLALSLRSKCKGLNDQGLDIFIVQTLLPRGLASTTGIVFFAFEVAGCRIDGSEETCRNTTVGATYLSASLIVLTLMGMVETCVPEGRRRSIQMMKERLANWEFRIPEAAKGILGVAAGRWGCYF